MSGRITDLNKRVIELVERGDYSTALSVAEESLELTGTDLGRDTQAFATSLNNLAAVHYQSGRYAKAIELYERALQIEEPLVGDTPDFATTLNNVAEVHFEIGDYARARPLYERALEINRRDLEADHPYIAAVLQNLGALHLRLGEYAEAERLLTEAVAIYRRAPAGETADLAGALNSLGLVHKLKGDYANAETHYQEAFDILKREGASARALAVCLTNLAGLYESIGSFREAEERYLQVLATHEQAVGRRHPDAATALNNLGDLYDSMGRFDEAVSLHREALDIRRQTLGEKHPAVATSLNNLAGVAFDTGHIGEAIDLYRQVLTLRLEALGRTHPHTAQSLNNLGMAYLAVGDYAQAEPLLEEALAIRRTLFHAGHPDLAETLMNLAVCFAASNRAAQALAVMTEAAGHDDCTLTQVLAFANDAQRLEYLQRTRKYVDVFLSFTTGSMPSVPDAIRTTCDLIVRRKGVTVEVMAAQRDAVLSGRHPELAARLRQASALRVQMAAKTLAAAEADNPEEQRIVAGWQRQIDELETDLARAIPELDLSARLRVADTKALAAALLPGTALIEFVRFHQFDFHALPAKREPQWRPPRYVAVVVVQDTVHDVRLIDLGDAHAIDLLIARFRTAVSGERAVSTTAGAAGANDGRQLDAEDVTVADGAAGEAGEELRRAVFDPLTTAFAGNTRLILAPDAHLCRLPFESLPAGDGRFLVDIYAISYVGSARDILRFDAPTRGRGSAPLIVADPDFDLSADAAVRDHADETARSGRQSRDARSGTPFFRRLSGTRSEGARIAEMLGAPALMDRDALDATIKACSSPSILHLATHGFFLTDQIEAPDGRRAGSDATSERRDDRLTRLAREENPLLRSGLAFAGVNTWLRDKPMAPGAEDGLLTAVDVTALDLRNTELAVLSACDTGLGQMRVAEGVFGLRRAFVIAGVRTLVASLWKVPDDQTQELMVAFYGHVMDGLPVAQALRDAQRALKERHPEIRAWGAFICQGDPGPVSEHTRTLRLPADRPSV